MTEGAARGSDLPPGATFGRYTIVRRLGAGGMGTVYEALHRELQKRVALKVLHHAAATTQEARIRFAREGEAACRVRHPHIVEVFDVGEHDDVLFLVMELLLGEDLRTLIRREAPLPSRRVADTFLPVLAALASAHQQGIVHRDLKPENVFLARTSDGEVVPKILDFGISKLVDATPLTQTFEMLGTPDYMSPEQAHEGGKAADARSDQFAVGVILYECLTGRRPFESDSVYTVLYRIVQGAFEPPRALRPDLEPEVESLVLRAMAREPEARFVDVRALGEALYPHAGGRARARWADVFGPGWASSDPPAPRPPETRAGDDRPPGADPPISREVEGADAPPPRAAVHAGPTLRSERPPAPRGEFAPRVLLGRASVLVLAALLAALAIAVWLLRPGGGEPRAEEPHAPGVDTAPPSAATYRVRVNAVPTTARLVLDDGAPHIGALDVELPRDGAAHHLVVTAEGYAPQTHGFRDTPPPERIALAPLASPSAPRAHPAPPASAVARPGGTGRGLDPQPRAGAGGAASPAPPPSVDRAPTISVGGVPIVP